mgnify:CR=1 FL=1
MGYNYYLLLQCKNDDEWINIDYFQGSGTYGLTHYHYFMSHMFDQPEYTEILDESMALLYEMGEYQFIFTYETIRNHYIKYSTDVELLYFKGKIDSMLNTNITRETFQQISDEINKFLEKSPETMESTTSYNELNKYYQLCEKYREEYKHVRIIFGYEP